MTRIFVMSLLLFSNATLAARADRLKLDDRASLWPRASATDKVDFSNRMGKAFVALSPGLDREYFLRCLEETANIGDTGVLTLQEMVKTCVSLQKPTGDE
jgi:hypothetical protein